jgi:PAS domain S-box-containing protein
MMQGLQPSDVVGRTLSDLGASAAEIYRVERSERRLLAEGGSIRDELRACHVGDRRRWLSTTRTTIRDERGHRGIAGVVRDLTDRVEATEALQKNNAELEQFAYVTSHELQEPVRAIANYSELLKEHLEGKLEAPADTFLHYIAEGAVRMRQRVAALLEYCRMDHQGQRLSPVSVAAALDDVRLDLRMLLNETGATLHVGELPSVLGDKTQLTRLLRNLVENALKFRASQSPVVRIDATLVGSHCEFSVADNGIGLDTRKADRIFQMFQRLHRQSKYHGHGIGLAMCKRIVDLHGGTIWVESQMGKGATFKFTLMAAPMLD